mmetsp:Transcript_25160/g.74820  ORF Transcript_25160/g.74820 Transcript_25160/m.74820 type:complete len:210 (+) Transcript_25160:1796-2425(+)
MTKTDLCISRPVLGSFMGSKICWKLMKVLPRVARWRWRAKRSWSAWAMTPAMLLNMVSSVRRCPPSSSSSREREASYSNSSPSWFMRRSRAPRGFVEICAMEAMAVWMTARSSSVALRLAVRFALFSLNWINSRWICLRRASTSSSLYLSAFSRKLVTLFSMTSSWGTRSSSSFRNRRMRSISSIRWMYFLYGRCMLRAFMSSNCILVF